MQVDQLGDEIGVEAVGLHRKGHAHLAGNGQLLSQRIAAIDQTVVRQ